jgi:hypothetical protein
LPNSQVGQSDTGPCEIQLMIIRKLPSEVCDDYRFRGTGRAERRQDFDRSRQHNIQCRDRVVRCLS